MPASAFPIGKWEPYLKAGVFYSTTELVYSGSVLGDSFGARFKDDDEDALYGVGVRYAVNGACADLPGRDIFHGSGRAGHGPGELSELHAGRGLALLSSTHWGVHNRGHFPRRRASRRIES